MVFQSAGFRSMGVTLVGLRPPAAMGNKVKFIFDSHGEVERHSPLAYIEKRTYYPEALCIVCYSPRCEWAPPDTALTPDPCIYQTIPDLSRPSLATLLRMYSGFLERDICRCRLDRHGWPLHMILGQANVKPEQRNDRSVRTFAVYSTNRYIQ